ncbi:MAG: transferase [Proteobacteria bacterium]|nr:transferase [Pseudomonadota bacterium]
MKELEKLFERIILRTSINLRELNIDVQPMLKELLPYDKLMKFYAFYGITSSHPLDMQFTHSCLSGSYFLGKCRVKNAVLYKSDIRGDELKKKGDLFAFQDQKIPLTDDEGIVIEDSFLNKTLVHNYSHDPETLENFFINDTISLNYANIHGSPTSGCFLGPFSTVDLTTVTDSVVGTFSYVQAGEISHLNVAPGTVWVKKDDTFNFLYRYPMAQLNDFVYFSGGKPPQGQIVDFVEDRKEAFQMVFDKVNVPSSIPVPKSASLDRYAVTKPETHIGENVLVSQRAFLQNAWLGQGANAQENCYIINSKLEGNNVTAHGAKIIEADLGKNVFVGFNSFLRGRPDCRLSIEKESIIMPHTIIDAREKIVVPAGYIAWGMITNPKELEANSMAIVDFKNINAHFSKGRMFFEGSGTAFVNAFRDRIHHILEANGAFYNASGANKGHAQNNQNISFNTLQPYPQGRLQGLYPTLVIKP